MDPEHLEWREEHFSGWTSLILEEIRKNKTYIIENRQVGTSFENITCPFQCNFNGDCKQGTMVEI